MTSRIKRASELSRAPTRAAVAGLAQDRARGGGSFGWIKLRACLRLSLLAGAVGRGAVFEAGTHCFVNRRAHPYQLIT
eukprot:15477266-Alexandrium_andersonii.AAC.1